VKCDLQGAPKIAVVTEDVIPTLAVTALGISFSTITTKYKATAVIVRISFLVQKKIYVSSFCLTVDYQA
jgi:hypothetical protein